LDNFFCHITPPDWLLVIPFVLEAFEELDGTHNRNLKLFIRVFFYIFKVWLFSRDVYYTTLQLSHII
jgi:hypothetical protein